jgi:diaminohydroxyphosphoribosylaminopyrimidine deaminase/5-amino-6-(5-phosphoribosylamino)uracil reductase
VKAITAAGVRRVVVAVRDPNPRHLGRGLRFLRRAGVQVTEGVGAEAGEALLRPFAKWVTTGRPYVTLKLAMTLDGRIADARGRSRWITGEAARRWVHARRARSDAVLVGRETVRRDDPSLLATGEGRRAGYRVVVDTAGAVAPRARVVSDGSASRTILATTARCPARRARQYERRGVRVWRLPTQGGRVSLKSLFARLGDMGLLSVMCEGGAELAAGLVRAGLVDEYVFFVAPRILGGRGSTPAVTGKGWALRGAPRLRFAECVPVGADVMLRAFPASRGGSGRRA